MFNEKILILGVTGSIGENALKVIERYPERFNLFGFSYHTNFERAKTIQKKFSVKYVASSHSDNDDLQKAYWKKIGVHFFCDVEDILTIDYDKLLTAIVGAAGVKATYKASKQGKKMLIANKESLVMAGSFILNSALKHQTQIIPVDSEHNSLFRLINHTENNKIESNNQASPNQHHNKTVTDERKHATMFNTPEDQPKRALIQKMYITASGGPLYHLSKKEIENVKKKEVLAHPNWDMGSKISVDSASMANKALEIIEACHLFHLDLDEISAVIHPQSYIHAILKYKDGSYFFHGSEPDMLYPLSHSLFYPEEPDDWIQSKNNIFPNLTFGDIDQDKYPVFYLGLESARKGGIYPAIFNAANEEAVFSFLNDQIKFHEIHNYIAQALKESYASTEATSLDDLFRADSWARKFVGRKINQ